MKLASYAETLRNLSAKRAELLGKQKLLDQLAFQIDSKWNGSEMRTFLERTLLDMALGEMTDPSVNLNQALFYSYASIAVREIPEPTEDLIKFTIAYLQFSGLAKPRSPLAFINVRNYSNGTKSVTVKFTKADGISKLVERRLKVIEEMKADNTSGKEDSPEKKDERTEEFDETKNVHPKPTGQIINFAPHKVSELILKN